MHLDYRCFLQFSSPEIWEKALHTLAIEDCCGTEHTFYSLAALNADFRRWSTALHCGAPEAGIFDQIISSREKAFLFIHDHLKSDSFFEGLTRYMIDELTQVCPADFILTADYCDFDSDWGSRIIWFLGEETHSDFIEGADGFTLHDQSIWNVRDFLADRRLSPAETVQLEHIQTELLPDDIGIFTPWH